MKVSVASLGKFHAFDLAEQLRQRGMLHRLYTGYPRWMLPTYLKPYSHTFPWLFAGYMAAGRYRQEWLQRRLQWPMARLFDLWLARCLTASPCDVAHIWAQYGPVTTEKCKSLGITTVCDRGSTHILYQHRVLTDEYRRWGLPPPVLHPKLLFAELEQYRASDAICVPSRIAQASFMGGYHGREPWIIPYGVDLDTWRWQRHQRERFIVLVVGALTIRKGLPLVVTALSKWIHQRAEVWLVGTILKEVEPWLTDLPAHIHVKGPVPQRDLPALFAQASILLLASCEEGLPLVLGQGLASGLPVIASRETGVEELIQDGEQGVILKERSAFAIREAVETLYYEPQRLKRMRENVRALRPELSWSKYGTKMVEQYETL